MLIISVNKVLFSNWSANSLSRHGLGIEFFITNQEGAIDHHVLHAFGQLTGLLEGGLIRNGLRVEDDDVGITAFLKTPLLFRHRCGIFDDLGGDQGAFPDGIHPTQHSTLPDPSPQEVAVVPCSARVALQSLGEGPFIAQEPCPFLVGEGDRIGDDGPARIKHRHIQQTGVMGVIVFIQEVDDDGVSGTGLHFLHKLLFVLEGRIRFHQGEVVEVDSHPHVRRHPD